MDNKFIFSARKIVHLFIIYLLICINFSTGSYAEGLCSDEYATLDCLSINFRKLYHVNFYHFWNILHKAEKKVQQCNSTPDIVNFMKLIRIDSSNAEFNEFFMETIENLCANNSKCFFEGLLLLKKEDQIKIIEIVKTPIFVNKTAIKNIFINNKDNKKYSNLVELYFNKN